MRKDGEVVGGIAVDEFPQPDWSTNLDLDFFFQSEFEPEDYINFQYQCFVNPSNEFVETGEVNIGVDAPPGATPTPDPDPTDDPADDTQPTPTKKEPAAVVQARGTSFDTGVAGPQSGSPVAVWGVAAGVTLGVCGAGVVISARRRAVR